MKIKLEVKENVLKITKDEKDLNFSTEELEKILDEAIDNNVTFTKLSEEDYEKYKDDPYVALIYGIINATETNSDFRKKLDELKTEKKDTEKQLKDIK